MTTRRKYFSMAYGRDPSIFGSSTDFQNGIHECCIRYFDAKSSFMSVKSVGRAAGLSVGQGLAYSFVCQSAIVIIFFVAEVFSIGLILE